MSVLRLDRINWTTRQLQITTPKSNGELYDSLFRSIWRLLPDEAEYIAQNVYFGDEFEEEDASFSARRKMLNLRNYYLEEYVKQLTP